jgi:Copper type II ascorbate-dependent monooxygenase, C-terminal domain
MARTLDRLALVLLITAAGCGGSADRPTGGAGGAGSAGGSGSTGGGSGSGGGGGGGSGSAGGSFSVSIGPIAVAPGTETTQCILIKMPTTTDQDVVGIGTVLAPGSHHLIAYKSSALAENLTPTPCTSFEGVINGEAPIFIADSLAQKMTLPTGVSYHFPAGQMVRIEAHYLNATTSSIQGMGTVTFTPGPPMTYQQADIMMCGSVTALTCPLGGLPPAAPNTTLPVGTYAGGPTVDFTKLKVFALTSHQHQRGTDVKIWKSASGNATAKQLFDNPNWSSPPLQVYDDSDVLSFASGEGLSWQCSYDTSADSTSTCFGESAANNEMCFIWAYYYPSVGRFIGEGDCWR